MAMRKPLLRFLGCESGNYAITFAIVALPVMLIAGIAVEYSDLSRHESALQQAIDSGVLAAASRYQETLDVAASEAYGGEVVASNCQDNACTGFSGLSITVDPGKSVIGGVELNYESSFARLAGIENWDLKKEAEVQLTERYMEFHFVLDVSELMQIAASDADAAKLKNLTKAFTNADAPNGCAFSCHNLQGWEPYMDSKGNLSATPPNQNAQPATMHEIAQKHSIPVRGDVMRADMQTVADTIMSDINGVHADQIKVGLYAFSREWEQLSKATANSQNLMAAAKENKIDIAHYTSYMNDVFPAIAADIGKSGGGTSKKDRKKTVFILTDGVRNSKEIPSVDDISAIDPKSCDTFKTNGVRVVVLNIQYPQLLDSVFWQAHVKPIYNQIEPALKACASPDFYYTSADDFQIKAQLIKMAKDALDYAIALSK